MTDELLDSAAEQLAAVPGLSWSQAAWKDFLSCSPELQQSMLEELVASADPPGADWAHDVLKVLEVLVAVAGGVTGVTGAISGFQSVHF
jgi:hypothetical protein